MGPAVASARVLGLTLASCSWSWWLSCLLPPVQDLENLTQGGSNLAGGLGVALRMCRRDSGEMHALVGRRTVQDLGCQHRDPFPCNQATRMLSGSVAHPFLSTNR